MAGEELRAALEQWQDRRASESGGTREQALPRLTTGFLDGTHPIVDCYELKVLPGAVLLAGKGAVHLYIPGQSCRGSLRGQGSRARVLAGHDFNWQSSCAAAVESGGSHLKHRLLDIQWAASQQRHRVMLRWQHTSQPLVCRPTLYRAE